MEDIIVKKEDLSLHDCGGGMRHTVSEITIDSSQSPELQLRAVVYEVLSAFLDSIISHEKLQYITEALCDAIGEVVE